MADKVQWPGKSVFDPSADDISKPLVDLLTALREMDYAKDSDGNRLETTTLGGTPPGLQVITAGASSVSKLWTMAIAALGGGTAIWASIKGLWSSSDTWVQASFVIAGAGLGATVCIALAIIVRGDLSSRAMATSSRRQARAQITSAMLQNYQYVKAPEILSTNSQYVVLRKEDEKWYRVKTLSRDDLGIAVVIADDRGTLLHQGDIKAIFDLTAVPRT